MRAGDLFDDDRVHAIHVTLSPEEYDRLERVPFDWSRGTAEIDGEALEEVGIQRKGNTMKGAGTPKTSFKVSFVTFKKGRTYRGLRRLVLNTPRRDPSFMREKLAYDLFRAIGCVAPRASYASLHLTVTGRFNREPLGLYVIVEHVGKPFLDDRFKGHAGNLYRSTRADDPFVASEGMTRFFRLKTNRKNGKVTRLEQLARGLREAKADPGRWLDVDAFLRCLVVNTALVNLDSYAGTGQNYFLYDDPIRKKLVYIPWDMDQAFGGLPYDSRQAMLDFDVFAPHAGAKLLIGRVLGVRPHRERYRDLLRTFLETTFLPNAMRGRIDSLASLIERPLANDPHARFAFALHQRSLEEDVELLGYGPLFLRSFGLQSFIRERHASMLEQLSGRRKGSALHNPQGF